MKNIQEVPGRPFFRVPMRGAPPLKGWAVQYVSGMESLEVKPGDWLSRWDVNSTRDVANFTFEHGLEMVFATETEAKAISDALRTNAEIETRVVHI